MSKENVTELPEALTDGLMGFKIVIPQKTFTPVYAVDENHRKMLTSLNYLSVYLPSMSLLVCRYSWTIPKTLKGLPQECSSLEKEVVSVQTGVGGMDYTVAGFLQCRATLLKAQQDALKLKEHGWSITPSWEETLQQFLINPNDPSSNL